MFPTLPALLFCRQLVPVSLLDAARLLLVVDEDPNHLGGRGRRIGNHGGLVGQTVDGPLGSAGREFEDVGRAASLDGKGHACRLVDRISRLGRDFKSLHCNLRSFEKADVKGALEHNVGSRGKLARRQQRIGACVTGAKEHAH